ncbi:hypothetical protein ES703_101327 [subsurface metagenome]
MLGLLLLHLVDEPEDGRPLLLEPVYPHAEVLVVNDHGLIVLYGELVDGSDG